MTSTTYAHVENDEGGVPYIAGTRTKVIEVILDHIAWGLDADQIHKQHPHLSIASIHSALAYFYDHKPQIENEIKSEMAQVDAFFASRPSSPALGKLHAARESIPSDER